VRPLKFKSEKTLQKKIDAYFKSCWEVIPATKDKPKSEFQAKPYTITGLASFLGVDRKTLLNYEKREKFFPTIKNAKTKIEAWTEEQLHRNTQVAGVIFSLKNNYGWKDTQQHEHTGEGGGPIAVKQMNTKGLKDAIKRGK
jgi:DNA-binding XRE family transcriptional regulator